MEGSVIDQNSNQQPVNQLVDSVSRLGGHQISDFETSDGVMEERFRHLKAATLRAGLHMGRRPNRNLVETAVSSVGPVVDGNGTREIRGGAENGGMGERTEERGKGHKRESSYLVARALETSSYGSMAQGTGGNFYDCNICLNIAREPILTCCGHLFCWACFCKLPYVHSIHANALARECPVCDGEVNDSNIVPIFVNGDSRRESNLESGMKIPPRPKARRVESVRQLRVARGLSHIPVAEALRRIRTSISTSTMVGNSSHGGMAADANNATLPREGVPLRRPRRFTRVLSESAAALSSISLALNDAERLVHDIETFFNDDELRRTLNHLLSVNEGNSRTGNAVVTPLDDQISTAQISSTTPAPPDPSETDHVIQ